MKRIYLLSLILLPVLLSGITLPECISAAEKQYAARPNEEIYEQIKSLNTQLLTSKWYPQLNLSASYAGKSESTGLDLGEIPFDISIPEQDKSSYEVSLNLQQMLFDGGMISRNRRLSELRSASNILEVRAGILQRKILVSNLYYQMLLAQSHQKILSLHKANLAAELRKVEAGIKAGILDKTSSLLIQDQLWQLASETFKVKYLYQECQQKLSSITAIQFTAADSLEDYKSELFMPEEITRPELEIMDRKREIELTQTRLSGSGMLPQLTATAAYAWGNPGYDIFSEDAHTYYRVGVYFNWQLWDWHSNLQTRKLHQKMANAIENNRTIQAESIELAMIEKDNQIERLTENLKILSERQALLSEVTSSSAYKLEKGIISAEDYLQQFNKQKEIELEQSASELEVSFQRILRLFIMGGEL
ncbi:MAG: TolC family protein [Candidatus Cloacimonetes bacterium]|nr:TolC family protein [Candidatus Cloacimonadota bacterium]